MNTGIQVNGDNNRTAGRDYHEHHCLPCARCEVRFVTKERSVCNHCTQHEHVEQAKLFFMSLLAAVLVIGFPLHKWLQERGLAQGVEGFFSSMLLALVLVFCGGLAVLWIKIRISQRQ